MKNPSARDKAIEKLVGEKLRQKASARATGCADAEILAAYVEGALAPAERRRWETHFASCGRCQEQVAELVRWSEAGQPQEVIRTAPPWRLRWAWAATALVAVLAAGLWYTGEFAPRSRRIPETQSEVTTSQEKAALPIAPEAASRAAQPSQEPQTAEKGVHGAPRSAQAAGNANPAAVPAFRERKQRVEVEGAGPANQPVAPAPPYPAPQRSLSSQPAAIVTPSERARLAAGGSEAVFGQATPPAAPPRPSTPATGGEPSPASATPQASAGKKPGLDARDDLQAEKEAAVPPRARKTAPLGAFQGSAVSENLTAKTSLPAWRVGPHGLIQKAGPSGRWETVPSGVESDLYDISFASPQVGWAVGQAGTLLRTTDGGKTWSALTPPTSQDLLGVWATNDLSVGVTTRAGQTYSTTDGGKSWKVSPQP